MWSIETNKLVTGTLLLLAALPFAQIFNLNLGFVILNAQELILLFLILALILHIFINGARKEPAAFLFLSLAFFSIYISLSIFAFRNPISDIIFQTRFFLPFFSALLILSGIFVTDIIVFLNQLLVAVSISAVSALIIHFQFPDFIATQFDANPDVSRIALEGGRMIWGSASLTFFCVVPFVLVTKRKAIHLSLMILVGSALLFTQNRTLPAFLLLTFYFTYLNVTGKKFRPIMYLVIFSGVFFLGLQLISDDNVKDLFLQRFFLGDSIADEYERAFLLGRVGTYSQFFERIVESFPWGQGFGSPMSVSYFDDTSVFTTDVSFISFLLPLGILGVLIFTGLLVIIGRSFWYPIEAESKLYSIFLIIGLMALLASFNVDLFSRNIFIVFLSFFAALLRTGKSALFETS